MDECEWALCVCGYHVYCEIWEASVGEVLTREKKPRNTKDSTKDGYAVVVKKDGTVFGHLPRKVSRFVHNLRRGGSIHCTMTRRRRYPVDLPQGGLEIPCFVCTILSRASAHPCVSAHPPVLISLLSGSLLCVSAHLAFIPVLHNTVQYTNWPCRG